MENMTALAWPEGKRGAVSLTYDDALPVHYEHVAPLLEEHGLRATFYTNVLSLGANPEAWRQVAARGHELGNHSIFHPCRKSPRHGWLDAAYDLKTYTPRRWTDEMRAADIVLNLVDGRTKRSFGNTCCNTEIGEGETAHSLEPLIDELFVAGRGPLCDRTVTADGLNLAALGHFSGDARTFDALREEIEAGAALGGWTIYMIHGVGEGTHGLFIDPEEHRKLVEYLSGQTDIWTAPLADVASHLRGQEAPV
jgi:hypothetical protein